MQQEKNEYEEKPLKAAGHYFYDKLASGFDQAKLSVMDGYGKTSIDEVAVGSKTNMMIEEFPADYDPNKIQEDNKEIPLMQRLKSKVFKQRQQAFEALHKLFEESTVGDPIFEEYFEMFVPFIQDSHPMCQEKALNVIVIWIKKYQNFSQLKDDKIIEICRNILEKAYSLGKANIKTASLEIFCLLFETGQKTNIISSILSCIQNKNQKISCGVIAMISELLLNFGPKQLDYLKAFYNDICGLSESTQSSVRQSCLNFYKDAYKWMGGSIKVFTKQLKKQQQDELESFFNSYEQEDLKPLRIIEEVQTKGKKENLINEYDLVEAKDVYKAFQDDWCDKVLQLPKWQEKVEMLNLMLRELCYPKHSPTNFYPLFSLTKKLLNEQNLNILHIGIKMAGYMAEGLRKVFSNSAKNLVYNLIQKLKDKKTNIINETLNTIQIFFNFCINLDEISEDLKVQLQDKNPCFKVNILNLLEKILEKNPTTSKTGFKAILVALKKLFEDGNPEVREKSIQLIVKLKNQYNDSFFGNLFQDVNPKIQQKINSMSQQPTNIQPIAMIEEKPINEKLNLNPTQTPNVQPKSNPLSSDQCLEKLIKMGYSEETLKKLNSQESKQFALKELSVQQIIPGSESFLICLLKLKFKDFKDPLMKEVCNLVEKLSQFKQDEKYLPLYMELIIEKLADYKFIDICSEIFKNICKKTGPKPALMILRQCLDVKKVNPKTLENLQINLIKLIQSFNIKHMPVKLLVDLMKELVQHQNSNINKGAVALGKVLYQYIGKDFKNMINDLTGNPQKILLAEIEKTSVLSEIQKKTLQCETIEEVMEEEEQANVVMKRTDISRDIHVIMRQLNDNDWKIRTTGLEKLQSLISENYNSISLNGLRDLMDTLKNKLSDPNKGLVIKFVQFIGSFAEAAGPDIKKYSAALLPALISNLSDKQITLRQDVITSIEKFSKILGVESILNHFPSFLNQESMELKKEILTWVLGNRDFLPKIELKPYINPILNQLSSKQKEIRQLAEELLAVMSSHITMNNFFNQMSGFKPAIQQQLKQIIERVYGMNMVDEGTGPMIQTPHVSVGKIPYPSASFNKIPNLVVSLKQQRIINEEANPWPYTYLNDGLVNTLQRDFIHQDIPIDLVQLLFSRDYRKNIEAASFIRLNLTQAAEISDLIIKWSSMMLHGQMNDDIAEGILSMNLSLINILHIENYQLQDFESQIMLNSLSQYMKTNKNKCRHMDLIIKIFEAIKHIVYSNTIVSFLFQQFQDPEYIQIQNEILKILGGVYVNDISAYLGHLAQIPYIQSNTEFMENLQKAYGQAELTREGFKIESQATFQPLTPSSQALASFKLLKDANTTWEQKNYEITQIYQNWTQRGQPLSEIFDCIIDIFQQYVRNKQQYQTPSEFILNYINLLNKIVSDKDTVLNLPIKTLRVFTQMMLNQMLVENENKDNPDSEQMVKVINSITLKLLEYSDWIKMIITLFDILIQMKKEEEEYSKLIGLIVKCILKQAKLIDTLNPLMNLQELLLKFHEYNLIFVKQQQFNINNDIGAKTIKTVLRALILIYGPEKMFEDYKIIATQPYKDEYIFIWITSLIGEIQSQNQNQSNEKNISIAAIRKSQIKQQLQQIQNNIDEKMQPIVEGIIKNEEVDKYIQMLQELINQNPQLQWSGYFTQFPNYHEYIALIYQKLQAYEGNENINNIQNSGQKNKSPINFKYSSGQKNKPSPINIKLMDAQQIDQKFEILKQKFMGGDIEQVEQMSINNQEQIKSLNFLKQQYNQ